RRGPATAGLARALSGVRMPPTTHSPAIASAAATGSDGSSVRIVPPWMITKVSLRSLCGPGCKLEVPMSKVVLLATAAIAALAFAGPVPAQTGNAQFDGNLHPNAGALLAKRADTSLLIACSGTLVSKRVFLTAGHCAEFLFSVGQFDAFVTFDPNFGLDPGHGIFSTPFHGTVIQNPGFKPPFHNDTAIVFLDAPVAGITPATLAP